MAELDLGSSPTPPYFHHTLITDMFLSWSVSLNFYLKWTNDVSKQLIIEFNCLE